MALRSNSWLFVCFRDLPYGLGFDKFQLEKEKREISASQTAYVDPNVSGGGAGASQPTAGAVKAEVTALSCRYTYAQDPNSTDPKLLPPPRKTLVKPIRDGKNVRNMRLRPRKVLCSNCKQGIHDNKVQGSTTSVDSTTCQNQSKLSGEQSSNNPPRSTLRMSLRGKRKIEEVVPGPVPTPKRPRRECILSKVSKASPVIKISFTSPQGEVHTSKLQTSRSTAAETDETETESSPRQDHEEQGSYEYRRLKKALKKAKLKERWEEGISEVTTTVPDENAMRHHKRSKRNKHKKKHRHRSLSIRSPIQDRCQNYDQNNTSDFENDAAKAGCPEVTEDSQTKAKELEEWEGYHVYHEASHPKETPSHFKENSINVPPRQQHTPTRPFHPPDLPHIEDPQNVAAAARSPYANRSSCANSQNGSVSPSSNFDTDDEGDMPPAGDEFPLNESEEQEEARIRPLMMRIQTRTVNNGILPDGRSVRVGEVVWGKIHGFPWWPGKILSITLSQRDNGTVITQMAHIAWCGSSTMSHMPCSELYPFLEDFKYRYNKKKKGTYKNAIKEATRIAQSMCAPQTSMTPENANVDREDVPVDS